MLRRAALAPLLATALLPSPAWAAGDLWTEVPQKGRSAIAIPSVAPLVQRLEPAVLVIFTEGQLGSDELPPGHPPVSGRGGDDGPGDDDNSPDMQGQGAGFLITKTGYALTNQHVIENATRITVVVGESHEELPAHVVGVDSKTDVALIQIDSARTDWPVVPLGDSGALQVGDFVVAIGSPFGLPPDGMEDIRELPQRPRGRSAPEPARDGVGAARRLRQGHSAKAIRFSTGREPRLSSYEAVRLLSHDQKGA